MAHTHANHPNENEWTSNKWGPSGVKASVFSKEDVEHVAKHFKLDFYLVNARGEVRVYRAKSPVNTKLGTNYVGKLIKSGLPSDKDISKKLKSVDDLIKEAGKAEKEWDVYL